MFYHSQINIYAAWAQSAAKAADEYIAAFPLLREDMLHVREALGAELEEQAATADKAVRRHEHRKRQRQARGRVVCQMCQVLLVSAGHRRQTLVCLS